MNIQISSKLAALALALMVNSLIIGGVGYLFDGQVRHNATAISLDHAAAAETVV